MWEAHIGLADEMAATGDFSAAEHEYAQVIQLQPAISAAHLRRGEMLEKLGRNAEALREFEEADRLQR